MNKVEAEQIFTEDLYQLSGKTLVLLPLPWQSIQQSEIILLSKILGSVKLSLDAVQVISLAEADVESLKIYDPSYVLSFGCKLKPETKPFTTETINGVCIVQSESLINLDDAKKKSLWIALKQAFKL